MWACQKAFPLHVIYDGGGEADSLCLYLSEAKYDEAKIMIFSYQIVIPAPCGKGKGQSSAASVSSPLPAFGVLL